MQDRIRLLINMVPACERAIDVGCDHGYVAEELARRGDVKEVLATDISAGSLKKLRDRLGNMEPEVSSRLSTRVTDGLVGIDVRAGDVIIVAGMGGDLIARILERFLSTKTPVTLVLGPQGGLPRLRALLAERGYEIVREQATEEDGKYYEFLYAVPARKELSPYSDEELEYGRILLGTRPEALLARWEKELAEVRSILDGALRSPGNESQKRRREALLRKKEALEAFLLNSGESADGGADEDPSAGEDSSAGEDLGAGEKSCAGAGSDAGEKSGESPGEGKGE